MSNMKPVLDVHQKPRVDRWILFSLQHLFAMFGATILVPYLVGLEPAVALISSGLGTLAYLIVTRGQIPAYLGSSFAFIAPILTVMASPGDGIPAVMFGSFVVGLVYGIVAMLIKIFGTRWLRTILPPIVVGPVIIVIGLGLAGVAIDMAMLEAGTEIVNMKLFSIALVALAITIIGAIFFKGFFGLIPILLGIIAGYIYATLLGVIDFNPIREAAWIGLPEGLYIPFVTYTPMVSLLALGVIVPVALVTLAEHVGDQMVLSKIMDRDLLQKPGLHRSIFGDGLASIIASLIGGPPNTTYGENIGVIAITRIFSVFVVGGAAVLAILFGFSPKVSELIRSIPSNVMGGVSILLFGIIASSGLRMLIDSNIQISEKRNLVISSVILVIGIGGAFINLGEHFHVAGMALAAITGVALNLILPGRESVK